MRFGDPSVCQKIDLEAQRIPREALRTLEASFFGASISEWRTHIVLHFCGLNVRVLLGRGRFVVVVVACDELFPHLEHIACCILVP